MLQSEELRKAFTLVEIVVTMSLLAIVSTIAVISYSSNLAGARDSARMADMAQIKITLKTEKQKFGSYPMPGDAFQIVNSGASNVVAYQGFLNSKVASNELSQYPTDPLSQKPYAFSVTKSRQAFQVAMTLEEGRNRSLVDGDYKSVSANVLPSIVLAVAAAPGTQVEIANGVTTGGSSGTANRTKFVVSGGTANLPYDKDGNPVANSTLTFAQVVTESGSLSTGTARFQSCGEIIDAGLWIGPGEYQTTNSGGAVGNVTCLGNENSGSYSVSGTFGANGSGATVSVCGSSVTADASGNFSRSGIASGTACNNVTATRTGYSCTTSVNGPASLTANVTNVAGSCSFATQSVSCGGSVPANASATTASSYVQTWNGSAWAPTYSWSNGASTCGYACNSGYLWNGTSCAVATYSVSGSFGASGSGATVSVCGSSVTANASGNFSRSGIASGTACNNVTATRTGYSCTTSVNGPASLTANVTNVAGSCVATIPTISWWTYLGTALQGSSVDYTKRIGYSYSYADATACANYCGGLSGIQAQCFSTNDNFCQCYNTVSTSSDRTGTQVQCYKKNVSNVTLNGNPYYVAISGQHFTSCSSVCSSAGKTCSDATLRNFVTDFKAAYPTGNPYAMLNGMGIAGTYPSNATSYSSFTYKGIVLGCWSGNFSATVWSAIGGTCSAGAATYSSLPSTSTVSCTDQSQCWAECGPPVCACQ